MLSFPISVRWMEYSTLSVSFFFIFIFYFLFFIFYFLFFYLYFFIFIFLGQEPERFSLIRESCFFFGGNKKADLIIILLCMLRVVWMLFVMLKSSRMSFA